MKRNIPFNLPTQLTSLIGRNQEIDEICNLLQDPGCRLLTLVGPGGIGKTRLAIAVANHVTGYADGVVYVRLQAITSVELLPSAIADAAGIMLAGDEPLQDQLLNNLRSKRLLLVLDNFEQLLDGAELLVRILHETLNVKLLLTSREALSIREEWLYAVPGLTVPEEGKFGNAQTYGSTELFVDRARQKRHDFDVAQEAESIAAICRVVEGMPLAIELAASWLTVLDCAAIAERLQQSLDILDTPLRNLPERHRSMYAVFDQTWQILSAEERSVFSKLSVFRGGFTLEAADEVAGATLPRLSALVAKTLVRRETDGRYQIHELLRQYGAEKLAESTEIESAALRAHSAYFMQFLAARQFYFFDSRRLQATQEIGYEMENVRPAWRWAVDHMETEWIRHAGSALHDVCQNQSRYLEGVELFSSTASRLEAEQMTAERGAALAETLTYCGWLCIRLGRLDDAERVLIRALGLVRDFNILPTSNQAGYPLAASQFLALARGDYETATTYGEELLLLIEQLGEAADTSIPHYGIASAAMAQDDIPRAKAHAEKGLAVAITAGSRRNATFPQGILGKLALAENDAQTAKQHFEAAYSVCEEYSDAGCMAEHLANLAHVALLQQNWREMRRLFSRSHTLYEEIGDRGGIARAQLGLGIVAQKTGELAAARHHYIYALKVAAEARITPVILSTAATVGDFLVQDDNTRALGLRALSFVLQHPSCDGQTRQQIMDSLDRIEHSAINLSHTADTIESLTAALQAELAAPAEERSTLFGLDEQLLVEPLTERERDVLYLLADGRSNPQIAEELVVTVGTVKSHTSRIYRKLDVANRTQAVVRARELGLLT